MNSNLESIENSLSTKYEIDNDICPRCYVFPDGKVLHLDSFLSHQGVKSVLVTEFGYSEEEAELENIGVLRVNLGNEGFIALPSVALTSEQYATLMRLLDNYIRPTTYFHKGRGDEFMIIEPCSYAERKSNGGYARDLFHYYRFKTNGYTSDDYIKIIKRYYATGTLVENCEGDI